MEEKPQKEAGTEIVADEQELIAKRTAKDSVFCNLFQNKKYLLQLYQALHPEDIDTTEDDLTDVTIRNVLTDGIYNDVGFRNKDKVIILTEAQSTWSTNILVRMLLYLAETYHDYFMRNEIDLYSSTKAAVPEAELYIIFTGNRVDSPEYISLSEEFFKGKESAIEVKAKVLYGDDSGNIISQYVEFSKIFTIQVKKHGYTRKAVLETIHICQNRSVLTEYLRNRESEVVSIMMALFDEEYIQKIYHKRIAREAAEKAAAEAAEKAEKEATARAAAKAIEKEKRQAKNMYQMGISIENIAKIAEVPVETVKQWLDLC